MWFQIKKALCSLIGLEVDEMNGPLVTYFSVTKEKNVRITFRLPDGDAMSVDLSPEAAMRFCGDLMDHVKMVRK